MAHLKDMTKIMVKINDENHFKELLEETTDKLLVVDVHQDW